MTDQDKVREALEGLGPGFELVGELGRGATAIVYLVRDNELGRDLAVKVIRSSFAHDEEAVARLQREARLVARLQHPNIVRVYSARHLPEGSLALLMEHVPGRNLEEILRTTGSFSAGRAVRILRDVASALAYAHRRRIVHRDVKPENIYLDDEVGTARLADFGIARPWDRDARLTVPGEALGTPAYMSPEQIDGLEVDARTDVYSLGLVGYEMLAGEHPWEGDNLFNIIYKQKNEDLPDLRRMRPDVPRGLVKVLEKALEKDRDRRWESADAFLAGLDELRLEEDDVGAPVPSLPGREGTARGRRADPAAGGSETDGGWRIRRLGLAVLAVVVLGGAAWGWMAWRSGRGEGWVTLSGEDASEAPAVGGAAPGTPEAGEEVVRPVLEVLGGTSASGPAGATIPLAVRVSGDTAASRRQVRFRIVDGLGVLDRDTVSVDSTGVARVGLRLPDRPGRTTVEAGLVGGETGSGVRVEAVATPGLPQQVVTLIGDGQTGEADAYLPRALGVRVVDALGNPVPDTEVRFQVLVGEGAVAPGRARTDSLGRAFARWRLGPEAGEQRAAALVPSAEEATVVFQATSRAQTPAEPPPETGDEVTPPVETGPPADTVAANPTPSAPPRVLPRPLAVGGTHVCAIGPRGFVECRGASDRGQAGEASDVRVRFAALAAGVSHACGLDATGTAYCWGANDGGQLGDGSRTDRSRPTQVQTPISFTTLALGLAHSCGLDPSGRPLCWGRNVNGQLGDGTRDDHGTPRPTVGDARLARLAAGWNHTCGVDGSGRAVCWGLNADGQVGDGSRVDRVSPTPVAGGATFGSVVAGSAHTCGLGGGTVYCWGANGSGQLGIGGTSGRPEPVRVEGLPGTVVQVAAGAVHTCALLQDGRAWCWGQNIYGQVGDGSTTNRTVPVAVAGDLRFRTLDAGGGSTCGITEDGARYCWGLNQNGQLGDGTRTNRATPTPAGG